MKRILFSCIAVSMILTSCYYSADTPRGSWAKGGDLSWLSEMEHDSVVFRDETGASRECMQLLHECGMNAVRLRVWVNHSTGLPDGATKKIWYVSPSAQPKKGCG